MSHAVLPSVIADELGALRFNGCTAEERIAALDEPSEMTIPRGNRMATGRERAARREGPWHFSIEGEVRFVVNFIDDEPVSPADGWNDHDWPRPSLERHRTRRQVVETMLREYRHPEDIERLYSNLVPRYGNSIAVVQGLIDALGLTLAHAKSAVEAACERANLGAVSSANSVEQ